MKKKTIIGYYENWGEEPLYLHYGVDGYLQIPDINKNKKDAEIPKKVRITIEEIE